MPLARAGPLFARPCPRPVDRCLCQGGLALTAIVPGTTLVTVVICGYNQATFIADAIESVLAQDYRPVEVIVVDNGSSDGTATVLDRYEPRPEVTVLRHDANGPITARLNHGIGNGRGQLVGLLYADDLYLPNKLSYQVEAFASLEDEFGVVYTPGIRRNVVTGEEWVSPGINSSGRILTDLLLSSQRGRFINPVSPLVRRECFEVHRFYEDLFVEGEAHYLRVATTHKFAFLPEPTVVMREHETNIGKAFKLNGENKLECLRRLGEQADLSARERRALRTAMVELQRNLGWLAIRVLEDQPYARGRFRAAVRASPLALLRPKVAGGTLLSLLPRRALRAVNRAGYHLHAPREQVGYRDAYD